MIVAEEGNLNWDFDQAHQLALDQPWDFCHVNKFNSIFERLWGGLHNYPHHLNRPRKFTCTSILLLVGHWSYINFLVVDHIPIQAAMPTPEQMAS